MLTERTWEEETLALIEEAKKEEQRTVQRVVSAEQQRENARQNRLALERALTFYRKTYGVVEALPSVSPEELAAYQGLSAKDTLSRWAREHGGTIVMNHLAGFVTAAGFYRDKQQAAGALYPAAQRAQQFEKVSKGVYRDIDARWSERLPNTDNGSTVSAVDIVLSDVRAEGETNDDSDTRSDGQIQGPMGARNGLRDGGGVVR